MRPVLKPALRRLWRDESTLQLGVDPRRAVVLEGVGPSEVALLSALDGTRDRQGMVAAAECLGVAPRAVERLLDLLQAAGALDDGAAQRTEHATLPRLERERLAPDVAALSLTSATPQAVLTRRRRSVVKVVGVGRLGAQIAALLAAAGVGRLCLDDPHATRPGDAAPGGLRPEDAGLPRTRAAAAVVRRAAPITAIGPLPPGAVADLTVVAAGPISTAEQDALLRAQAAHLSVTLLETTGVVGPLVIPGRTPCLRCLDLTRTERDPAWPQLAAQLAGTRDRDADPCDVVLASTVAAHAVQQALHYLDRADGAPSPATVGGTLVFTPPDWRVRRRSWDLHPACACHWSPVDDPSPDGARVG